VAPLCVSIEIACMVNSCTRNVDPGFLK